MFKMIVVLFALVSAEVQAEEVVAKSPWAHESEISISINSGNSESETYSGKQTTNYTFDKNKVIVNGRYQKTQSKDTSTQKFVETAENWEAGMRYERSFSKYFAGYGEHSVSSDYFAGNIQKNMYGAGGKYDLIKKERLTLSAEAGYRNTFEYNTDSTTNAYDSLRAYIETTWKANASTSTKFWIEYLPSLEDSDDYVVNFEPSLTTVLSDLLSLKVSYLGKYDNVPAVTGAERFDSTFGTSLIAKF